MKTFEQKSDELNFALVFGSFLIIWAPPLFALRPTISIQFFSHKKSTKTFKKIFKK